MLDLIPGKEIFGKGFKNYPCSVVVNHAGLWIRRRQFESAQGYGDFGIR